MRYGSDEGPLRRGANTGRTDRAALRNATIAQNAYDRRISSRAMAGSALDQGIGGRAGMADAAIHAARSRRTPCGRSRLRLRLVLPLGARARRRDVLGLDLSENMLERARAQTNDGAATYATADLEEISLPDESFDVVYSSLAFHYVDDAARLYAAIRRALVPGGHLVFSTEHPIFMAPSEPGWRIAEDGRKTWPVDSYFARRPPQDRLAGPWRREVSPDDRDDDRLAAPSRLAHRARRGVLPRQIAADPALVEEIERPMFVLVAATAGPLPCPAQQ